MTVYEINTILCILKLLIDKTEEINILDMLFIEISHLLLRNKL